MRTTLKSELWFVTPGPKSADISKHNILKTGPAVVFSTYLVPKWLASAGVASCIVGCEADWLVAL